MCGGLDCIRFNWIMCWLVDFCEYFRFYCNCLEMGKYMYVDVYWNVDWSCVDVCVVVGGV